MKDHKASFRVPYYASNVTLLVCDDMISGVKKHFDPTFNESYEALAIYQGNSFAIILTYKDLTYENVCHELYHTTCRIMETMKTKAGPDNHEPYAYLQGYIGSRLFKQLDKWKLKLR